MTSSILVAFAALLHVAALTSPDELAERARFAERDLDYDRAADLWLEVIGNPETSDALRFEANLAAGAIERIRGNDTEARFHFQYVLRENPDYRLADETPPKVRNFFELVRQEVRAEIARNNTPAAAGAVVSSASPAPSTPGRHDDAVADAPAASSAMALPVLPVSLLVGGGAALVVAIVGIAAGGAFGFLAWDQYNAAITSEVQVDRVTSYEAAQTNALVANLGYSAGAVFAVGAVALAGAGGALWAIE